MAHATTIPTMLLASAMLLGGGAAAHDFVPAPIPSPRVDIRLVCGGGSCEEIHHRGQRWVVGEHGQRYEIELSNRGDRWVEAVVAVDGRNILDGDRSNRWSRGYLIPPHDSIRVEGWRTSHEDVAAFRFTSVADSYVGRIGDAHAAGAIRLEVYPERQRRHWRPEPRPPRHPWDPPRHPIDPWLEEKDGDVSRQKTAPSAEDFAPEPRDGRRWHDEQHLGTQFGESRWQPVQEREFERESQQPSQTVTLRYDDRDALAARGILPGVTWRPPVRWVQPPPR